MKRRFKELLDEIIYVFTNYFVCNIPFWPLRYILYRFLGVHIGRNSRILMKTVIVRPWRLTIGNNTIINERCFIDARGNVKIGDNVTIAIFSKLITGGHFVDGDSFSYKEDRIEIGNNCVIFANSTVLAGATLEKGCLFAANSLIKRGTYGENKVFAGNPATFIRKRNISEKYKPGSWTPLFR